MCHSVTCFYDLNILVCTALPYSSFTTPRNALKGILCNFFLHSPISGYLGYFQFLAPANSAATNNYIKCPYGTWGERSLGSGSQPFLHIGNA